jgi:hypothetical protein
MFSSFKAWLTGEPMWLVHHLMDLEMEVRGVPFEYNHWLICVNPKLPVCICSGYDHE